MLQQHVFINSFTPHFIAAKLFHIRCMGYGGNVASSGIKKKLPFRSNLSKQKVIGFCSHPELVNANATAPINNNNNKFEYYLFSSFVCRFNLHISLAFAYAEPMHTNLFTHRGVNVCNLIRFVQLGLLGIRCRRRSIPFMPAHITLGNVVYLFCGIHQLINALGEMCQKRTTRI